MKVKKLKYIRSEVFSCSESQDIFYLYKTGRFINVLTISYYMNPLWARSILFTPLHFTFCTSVDLH